MLEPDPDRPQDPGPRRGASPVLRALAVALPAVVLLVVLAATGPSAVLLAVAGLGAVLAGFVAVVAASGRPDRERGRARRGLAAVLAVGGAGMFLGGTAFGAPGAPAMRLPVPEARVAAAAPAARPLADALLDDLVVKGPSPMTGYSRARFGQAWADVDRNGCDTRNDVLHRDLTDRTESRCRVLRGRLHDPYTGTTIRFVRGPSTSDAVQIDHVVPLADAWRTGAQKIGASARRALANDPANLLAVDGPTNQAKGDGDAATWLPKRKSYRCAYVARQIAVKHAYGLWVTKAERAAMQRVLLRCPEQAAPVVRRPTAAATAGPSPSASATARAGAVHGGAYCSDPGARARSASGTRLVCRMTATDGSARWRRP